MNDNVRKLNRYCEKYDREGSCSICPVFNDEGARILCDIFDFSEMREESQEYLLAMFEQAENNNQDVPVFVRDPEQNENVNAHMDVCKRLNDLYKRKNNDYGNSFHDSFEEFGLTMSAIRLSDKLNRLKSLINAKRMMVKDESVTDTLLDLANYAIMTLMELGDE